MIPTVLFALLFSGIVSSGTSYEPLYHNYSHQDDGIIPQDTSLLFSSDFQIGDTKKSCFVRLNFLKNDDDLLRTDRFDSLVTAHLDGEKFQAGKVKKALFGKNYRQEWITPVTVSVFDIANEKGGLKVLKRGGGDQTVSLRLQDRNEKEWVLRSLDKDVSNVIPESIRIGMAEDVVNDQMSASLPWAAVAIPRIADAAGIYHTNPRVVYLPKDPLLGEYLDQVKEGLYLFEERPEGNRDDVLSFGLSKKIVSTDEMMEKIQKGPGQTIDQEHFLRSRLVDMLISDWDRHEDQWRWATFKENGKTIYRAIPRDRDMAFYVSEGFLIRLSSKPPF